MFTFSIRERPKVVQQCCACNILTWKLASRHNGVHLFSISTSKSGPTLLCPVHFDMGMCFAPRRCAFFFDISTSKVLRTRQFFDFLLAHVFRTAKACNLSSFMWPAGSAPAALASLLFDSPEPQTTGETTFRDFPTLFEHLHLLCSDFL